MNVCLESVYATNSSGYPVVWKNGKTQYHHRVVANASQDQVVLHTCDNKRCINPEHLKLGTHADNSADMVSKKRQATGERCGNSKLALYQVVEIRKLYKELSSRKVAIMYNISKTNVLDIWKNKIWRDFE